MGEAATQALGGVAQGVEQAGKAAGQAGQAGQAAPQPNGGPAAPASLGAMAKEVARLVAGKIRSAAPNAARDLGRAATRKVRELGEHRGRRRAEKYRATEAASRIAEELGIDLGRLEGTSNEGRITAGDVWQVLKA